MKSRFLPNSAAELIATFWIGIRNVNPLNYRILGLLAVLLFLTDIGYEGQRSPERITILTPASIASLFVFFLVFLALVLPVKNISNRSIRGITLFFIVILAEMIKSASLIAMLHFDEFLTRYLERLPGDISLAALYWLIAGAVTSAFEEHRIAIQELNAASNRLEGQRRLRLESALQTEANFNEKANNVLLEELERLTRLTQEVLDSAESAKLKMQIQGLIRNQVRPLSRELKSRAGTLNAKQAEVTTVTRFTMKSRLLAIPSLDSSFVASYIVSLPNIFLTLLSKTSLLATLTIVSVSVSYPVIGRLVQMLFPQRKVLVANSLILVSLTCLVAYFPTGITIFSFASESPLLMTTSVTVGAVLWISALLATAWFILQRERAENIARIEKLNQDIRHELDLLDQAIWVAQRKWSYLIHGTVQAALTVAASRLEMANRPDAKLRAAVSMDIERAKGVLTNPPELASNSSEMLKDIAQTWEGVCNFEYQISPSAELALSNSTTSATCFIEIVKELISNANRHGGATKFWLNAYLNNTGDLEIVAGNNGKPVGTTATSGMGFEMISTLTRNWSFEQVHSTGFSATMPMPRLNDHLQRIDYLADNSALS